MHCSLITAWRPFTFQQYYNFTTPHTVDSTARVWEVITARCTSAERGIEIACSPSVSK